MRGSRLFAATLFCTLGASNMVSARPQDDTAASPPVSKADQARVHALLSFQSDLVSVLAPSAAADRLLAAALLARPLPSQSKSNSFHALITRAAHADDAGPAENWVRLADCDAKAKQCPNADALTQLAQQAPDNAAVWLVKLSRDVNTMKAEDARQDLANAANAKIYDDYSGTALKALAATVSTLPPPPATMDPNSNAGPSGVQMLIAFSSASGVPQPALHDTATFCESKAPKDPSIKDDCSKLGKVMEWGSSPLARSLGLHLREVFNADPTQQQDAQTARHNLVWQVQNFAELSLRARNDKAQSQHLLALARTGGTQMSLILAALHDDGIPTEAPAEAPAASSSK